jgi:hypothetical protein
MIVFVMIVHDILGHGLLEVPLAHRNNAMETFMLDGPDEALSVGIRIRRAPRRLHYPDAFTQQPAYLSAPFRVPITNQDAMRAHWRVIRSRQGATDLPHE